MSIEMLLIISFLWVSSVYLFLICVLIGYEVARSLDSK